MKRMIPAAVAVMLTACSPAFTFVQMSDPQVGFLDTSLNYIQSDTLMAKAVAAVNALRPACVVITGDLVNQPWKPVQDSIFQAHLAGIQAPVHLIPGNHDIMGFTDEKRDAYVALRGYDRFSVRHRGCAFIGIDTNCIKDGAVEAEEAQWSWLETELERAQDARYIFVFVHCPVIRERIDEPEDYFNFPFAKRERYIGLFQRYGVSAVFAGHTHAQYAGAYGDMRFYTAAAVGNCLYHGYPGYHVIRVGRKDFTVEYVPTPGVDASTAQHQ